MKDKYNDDEFNDKDFDEEENDQLIGGDKEDTIDGEAEKVEPEDDQKQVYEKPKKKQKKKESVIKRLREKQIAIAVRSGKPVPRCLEQDMERRRG